MKTRLLLFLIFALVQRGFSQNYYMEDRWPNLKFRLPVGMFPAPDNSKRIFVIEQQGRIKVFKDSGNVAANDTSTFLDLTGSIPPGIVVGTEYGLLGFAFHPQFTQNGYVYVNYTRKNPLTTLISRFKVRSDNPNKIDSASEKILIQFQQPYTNHNGGSLLFGDDGYLYIATGDGGSGGDPGNRAQNKGVLLGKLLRIDVNVPIEDSLYLIPPDNPYATNNQGYKREIYAHGLRNPWKVTKDPESSTIWIGDVGQGAWEEVDTARLGANYGWKVMEGNHSYSNCGSCDTSNYEPPIYEYGHNRGYSITGGYVYRGEELFRLKGSYFFGDYGTRRIWGIRKTTQGNFVVDSLLNSSMGISSFGLDNQKEIYAIGFSATAGKLFKIRCGPPTPVITSTAPGVCLGDTIRLTAPVGANLAGYKWSTGDTTQSIKVFQPGSYTLTVQTRNTFGCWSYASNPVTVSVNIPPAKPVIANDTICTGDTAIFQLPSGLSYVWSGGFQGNPFSTTTGGNFWVVAKDLLGCKSDTARFEVAQFPKPFTPTISASSSGVCFGDTIQLTTPAGADLTGYFWSTGDTSRIIKLSEPGAYSISVRTKNALGCLSNPSLPVSVSINPIPAKPAVVNDTLCLGDTASFFLPPGLNYFWSGGFQGNPFSTTTGGSFWVIAKDNLGCQSDTARFDLSQFPKPATPFLTVNGDTLYTDWVAGVTYNWYFNSEFWQNTGIPKVKSEFEGVYHVSVVSAEGCESLLSNGVILSGTQALMDSEIRLIPNPTREFVDLIASNLPTQGPIKISIYNSLGQIIRSEKLVAENQSINHRLDLSAQPSGIYLIQVQSGSFQKMERVLKTD